MTQDMTPEQAYNTMVGVCRKYLGTAEDHEILMTAYLVIKKALDELKDWNATKDEVKQEVESPLILKKNENRSKD